MSADLEQLMTTDEVAALLAMEPSTIRKWCGERRMPYFKLNGAVRFRKSEVLAWIEAKAKPEITPDVAARMIGGR